MADGYKNAGEHDFADLDEWLCEYVDGTIDPVVCKALEEYMQQNPVLAAHVEQLCETRHLLCQYGCSYQAPSGLQPRLRQRLASEIIQESQPLLGTSVTHLMALATLTSFVAIVLLFAASSEIAYNNTPPSSTEQSIVVNEELPAKKQLFIPNRQATPLLFLSSNKYYSQFTYRPAVFRHAYLRPSLFPLNTYIPPRTINFATQPANVYTAP